MFDDIRTYTQQWLQNCITKIVSVIHANSSLFFIQRYITKYPSENFSDDGKTLYSFGMDGNELDEQKRCDNTSSNRMESLQ